MYFHRHTGSQQMNRLCELLDCIYIRLYIKMYDKLNYRLEYVLDTKFVLIICKGKNISIISLFRSSFKLNIYIFFK